MNFLDGIVQESPDALQPKENVNKDYKDLVNFTNEIVQKYNIVCQHVGDRNEKQLNMLEIEYQTY